MDYEKHLTLHFWLMIVLCCLLIGGIIWAFMELKSKVVFYNQPISSFEVIQGSAVRALTPCFSLQFAPLADYSGENDISLVQEVLRCESGFKQDVIGKAGEIGIAQYMPQTWALFNKIRGTNLDINNISDQLEMTFWAFNTGRENNWTCYRKLFK